MECSAGMLTVVQAEGRRPGMDLCAACNFLSSSGDDIRARVTISWSVPRLLVLSVKAEEAGVVGCVKDVLVQSREILLKQKADLRKQITPLLKGFQTERFSSLSDCSHSFGAPALVGALAGRVAAGTAAPPAVAVMAGALRLSSWWYQAGSEVALWVVLSPPSRKGLGSMPQPGIGGPFCVERHVLPLEHPHTVPADGAGGVEVEGHQVFWTCDSKPFISVLTTVPPHTDSLGVSTKTKAGLSCVVQPSADGAALTGGLMEGTTARWMSVRVVLVVVMVVVMVMMMLVVVMVMMMLVVMMMVVMVVMMMVMMMLVVVMVMMMLVVVVMVLVIRYLYRTADTRDVCT
ncbi:hypothetical protein NFI96_018414 [Prochilodus magdalenae]|nr:hypothetical protein NFI96_018414 [Prochilodus magdalenae]